VRLVTDVTGELAQVAGVNGVSVPLLWDPDAAMPQILGAGSMPAPGSDGGFSQVGIAGGFDPWAVPSMLGSAPDAQGMNIPGLPLTSSADDSGVWGSMLPAGFSFTGAGSVCVAGLDVMGARVFDGVSKRFLSTDPLAQVPGTGFFADVYAFCGNNPVGLMDPWGLKPMSPDEFQKYSRDKAWKDFGDYVAAGAMLFVGLALTAAAVATGPLGMVLLGAASGALMSGGMSVITQKMEGKDVDWSTVGRDALIGGLAGAAGGVVGGIFAKGAAVAKSMATAEKAAETGSKSVSRIVQMGVKASDKINAGITRIGNTKVVSAARNNKYINGASNWVGDKLYGKTFEGGVDELSGKVIGAGLQEGAKDATISSVKYAATTDQWNPKDQAVAGVMGFAGGFVFGGVGGGINHGMAASADLAKESGKTVGKLNSPYIRNYANDWVTSNGADAMALGLDQKMSAEEKAQKMVQKVGVNTAKSAFTAGAKTYGGKIKDARENASTPSGDLQTGSAGTVVSDE